LGKTLRKGPPSPVTERGAGGEASKGMSEEIRLERLSAAEVRASLREHGLARLQPMAEDRFVELAASLGEIELRTDLVIDPALEEEDRLRRRADGKPDRPVVYSPSELGFHTDRPTVDVIGWYCVEQDASDGAVLLIDTADLEEHFSAAELAALEKVEVGYSLRDRETGGEELRTAPLASRGPRGRLVYYAPWQLPQGTDAATARLLAGFAAYVERKRETSLRRIRLQPGESLLIDNHRLLHARGELSPASRRHIVRLYINLNDGTAAARDEWMEREYHPFRERVRRDLFLSIAVFCYQNRPLDGWYMEFGCHNARTMRHAFDAFHALFDWRYAAFDSFAGLPEIPEIDRRPIWRPGALCTSEEEFIRLVVEHGMPREKLLTVKGFYDRSLTPELKERLLPARAAVIYVDCDLYSSTVPVLEFVRDFLQPGTVLVFDDWFCFRGDPDRGERRAFREFRERYPRLRFQDFVQTHEAKAFIFLGEEQET
jgi:O-methyltransferase